MVLMGMTEARSTEAKAVRMTREVQGDDCLHLAVPNFTLHYYWLQPIQTDTLLSESDRSFEIDLHSSNLLAQRHNTFTSDPVLSTTKYCWPHCYMQIQCQNDYADNS